jgi:alpha-N-arabinofuranosidase
VGGTVNTLLRHADRVHLACLAQLVNVIAPLVTSPQGLLRQTIYYPYAWALQHARGLVLDVVPESDAYEAASGGRVPYLDVAGTVDPEGGTASLFVLNRDLEKARDLEVVWREGAPTRVLASQTLTGPDLKATNTFAAPTRVAPQPLDPPRPGARMTVSLPARSYSVIHLATK